MRAVPALLLVVALLALGAAPAGAATVIVRPNATAQLDPVWSVSSGGTADGALADAITHAVTPTASSDRLTAGFGPGSATLSFPAPSLPAGATVTGATAWVYSSVGILQLLTPSVWSGSDRLAQTTWLPGAAAWRSIALKPSAAQLSGLTLDLRTDGLIGLSNSTVYAAYMQVDATTPDRVAATGSAAPADAGDDAGDDGEDAAAPQAAAPGAATVVTPATVELPATAKAVPVEVGCPADAVAPCRGRVRIELLATAPAKKKARGRAKARSARCARGCRVIGDAPFTVAAGKRKPVRVKLKTAAYKLLPRGRTVKARVTVSSRDQHGRLTSATRSIAIHRARF
jgi:hypothetical protein